MPSIVGSYQMPEGQMPWEQMPKGHLLVYFGTNNSIISKRGNSQKEVRPRDIYQRDICKRDECQNETCKKEK